MCDGAEALRNAPVLSEALSVEEVPAQKPSVRTSIDELLFANATDTVCLCHGTDGCKDAEE